MNIPTIPICPPKKDTIIIRPTGCSNNKNYIAWNDIKNKPFQNIDKTFFSVDTSGNITLSKELNNNINYLNITVNEIKADSNIQPDWNQNDETKKDYIKNRTHWVEEKAVLEETTFTIEESDGMCALGNFPATLSAGDICTVVYDGKTYTCTVFEFGTDIAGIGCDAFEIAFQKQPDDLYAITIGSYAGEHTISILQTTYHTIPDEFIPWEESPTADSILYTAQSLTEEQQAQARANIGADFSTKMDANNPVGTGSFSMNRKAGTIVGVNSHAEGNNTTASRDYSHAEGNETTASGYSSHSEGVQTTASGKSSHAEGSETVARGEYSHAEGIGTTASGSYSHAEGSYTTASGPISHAEGASTKASGYYSHAEGTSTTASQFYSHAEGYQTTASGQSSHAEGYSTNNFSSVVTTTHPTTDDIITDWQTKKFSVAKGNYSHVEGKDNLSLGDSSHAEGDSTTASGEYSHAEGSETVASGYTSHAEGAGTIASGDNSHAQGKYNIEDTSNIYADIIGNGASTTARSNAATVDWNGNAWYAGDVYTGSTSGTNKDEGSKKLATEEYVNSSIAASGGTYYVELDGSFPNYTLSETTPLADITAAYNDGKALFCRCSTGNYTVTLPLFVPATELNTWIFSGSGGAAAMNMPAQYFTIVVSAQGVTAEDKGLVQTDAIVTSVSASSTDSEVPSAKCLYDLLGNVTALIDAM